MAGSCHVGKGVMLRKHSVTLCHAFRTGAGPVRVCVSARRVSASGRNVRELYPPRLFIIAQPSGVNLSWESSWTNVALETVPNRPLADSRFLSQPTNTSNQLAV